MQRLIAVNLGGTAFQLEENAYERLRAYLRLAESRAGGEPDRAAAVADLERAVAERCAAYRAESNGAAVSDAAMERLLSDIGNVDPRESASVAAATPEPAAAGHYIQRDRETSEYMRLPVLLLCLLLGWIGAHRFYVGKIGTGVLQLLTIGGLGLWILYDLILIACGEFRDRDGRKIIGWI